MAHERVTVACALSRNTRSLHVKPVSTLTYMWSPVLVPQITGGAAFPGEVTENWSSMHRDTSLTCQKAGECRLRASPPTVLPIVMVTVDGPAITEKEKEVENLDFLGKIVIHSTYQKSRNPVEVGRCCRCKDTPGGYIGQPLKMSFQSRYHSRKWNRHIPSRRYSRFHNLRHMTHRLFHLC